MVNNRFSDSNNLVTIVTKGVINKVNVRAVLFVVVAVKQGILVFAVSNSHAQSECRGALRCNRCLQNGHFASECTNEPRCLTCNEQGHAYWDCPLSN